MDKDKINIAIASDHAGFELKQKMVDYLDKMGYNFRDCGTHSTESVDYPDYANLVAEEIEQNKANFGILICGTGIGISIAANRYKHIRAALCHNDELAGLSREHNDANILVLGARVIDFETACACVDKFFTTDFANGRHQNRVKKLS